MRKFAAGFLFLLLVATVAVMWEKAKWATSVPEIGSFVLAAGWVLVFLTRRARPRLDPLLMPLCGVILWGLLQYFLGTTVYRWSTGMALLYWATNLAVFFSALQIFADQDVRVAFLKGLVFFAFPLSVFCAVQALTSDGLVYWYFPTAITPFPTFGPFVYRNQFAAFIELILPIALYLAIHAKRRKILYYLVVSALYASVLASASRGGFILSTLELAIVPMLATRRQSFTRLQLINGVLVLIAMTLWLSIPAGPDLLISRLGIKDPYAGRREFTESSLQMIKDRPLMGFGLGNWATAYPGYALFDDGTYANQAHNDWAQWTVEGGVPLLLMMMWIAARGVRLGLSTGWGLGVPIVFVHCCFDYPIQRPGVAVLFFVMLAAVVASGEARQRGAEIIE